MSAHLDQIIATHRALAAADDRYLGEMLEEAAELPEPRDFRGAIAHGGISVISEIKRRSPSEGDIDVDLDPATVAKEYESAGAACLSVLTDAEFFGGSSDDLEAARSAVSLPVLRKDFTVCEKDIVDARLLGADAVLLIVAALEDDELWRFGKLADRLDLAAIFEVHGIDEVERAERAGARIVGVNQRNLQTFEVDRDLAARARDLLPHGVLTVAESGIRDAADVSRLASLGYDAVLIGTSLVRAQNRTELLRAMISSGSTS